MSSLISARVAPPVLALLALGALAPDGAAQSPWKSQLVVGGLHEPVALAQPPGEDEYLFVVEKIGRIKAVRQGTVLPQLFLDLSVEPGNPNPIVDYSAMTGLTNLVFHPDYAQNGWFYVFYASVPIGVKLVRYTVPNPYSYNVDLDSALAIIDQPAGQYSFHNGGGMQFKDGKIFIGIGDSRIEFTGDLNCTAQNGQTIVGKILRLNDDGSIPSDNPFVGDPTVLDQIWGFGLRQPHRLSFDSLTGDLYIGDVGEGTREEVDVFPAGSAIVPNFGWHAEEGTFCSDTIECTTPGCGDPSFIAPIHDYPHNALSCGSVIGGYVYRGSAIPELQGYYVFGDWCKNPPQTGTSPISILRYENGMVTDLQDITLDLEPEGEGRINTLTSFGVDQQQELYVIDHDNGTQTPNTGEIYKIVRRKFLDADVSQISVATGGVQTLSLDAGPSEAGSIYWVVGSATGTSPGLTLNGNLLPLNYDAYFAAALALPNSPIFVNTLGLLDGAGKASAAVDFSVGLDLSHVGLQIHHAYALFDGALDVTFGSNPVSLDIVN